MKEAGLFLSTVVLLFASILAPFQVYAQPPAEDVRTNTIFLPLITQSSLQTTAELTQEEVEIFNAMLTPESVAILTTSQQKFESANPEIQLPAAEVIAADTNVLQVAGPCLSLMGAYSRCDVEHNGVINYKDVRYIIDYLNGKPINRRVWLDVNGDTAISPIDALIVINWLNTLNVNNDRSINELDVSVIVNYLNSPTQPPPSRMDMNGDGFVTANDALIVINYLNDRPWSNRPDRMDVNEDGYITPLDLLILINRMNQLGSGYLLLVGVEQPFYYDVNGDNWFSPIDLLILINCFNSGQCPRKI